jgi:hypothetical protein
MLARPTGLASNLDGNPKMKQPSGNDERQIIVPIN